MAGKAAIKGTVFGTRVEQLRKGLEDGSIDRAALEQTFSADEIALLTGTIQDVGWYDVGLYGRLLELLRDQLGGGDDRFLVESGRQTGQRMIDAGVHQQFDYLTRTQHRGHDSASQRSAAFGRDLRLLVSITGSILNFAKTEIVPDPEHPLRWIIEHSDAEAYPDALCWTSLGLVNRMAEEHGDPDLWHWERPRPDLLLFRMRKDV